MKTDKSALSLRHRDVGHSERGEDWVLVRVGGGGKAVQGLLRASQDRSGVSQDDVLRR